MKTVEEKLLRIATRPRPGVRVMRKTIGKFLEERGVNVSYITTECDNGLHQWTETDIICGDVTIYANDDSRTAAAKALQLVEEVQR